MKKRRCLLLLFLVFNLFLVRAQQIKGKVTDKLTGEPLPGAFVSVLGTKIGVVASPTGEFVIPKTNTNEITLEVKMLGYLKKTIQANVSSTVTIALEKQNQLLDEIVVIGYGTVKKRDLTGAVYSVKGEEVLQVPSMTPLEAIQGKVPGVDIMRNDGSSSGDVSITIRGNRSIGASNEPLYIVDGVQGVDISTINPNDIASIEFLKDASSTAIYGYQGANGIVIVTTKKGDGGKAKVSFSSYYGVTKVSSYPPVNDGRAFTDHKRQAYRTTGSWNSEEDDPLIFDRQELESISLNRWYNYPKLLLHDGNQQDYSASVSGGTGKTKAFFSLGYYQQYGLLKNDWQKRYTARLNVDHIISKVFKAGLRSNILYRDLSIRRDPLSRANSMNPLITSLDANGNMDVSAMADEQPGAYQNLRAATTINSNAFLEINPVKGLSFTSTIGATLNYSRTGMYESSEALGRDGKPPRASYGSTFAKFISWDNVATYTKKIKEHSFTLTSLTNYIKNVDENVLAAGEGQLLPSQLFYNLGSSVSSIAISSDYGQFTTLSYAGRLNYSYKGKYLLTATYRADGASRLSGKNKWASFPSLALAWRLGDENFMKNIKNLSDLKIRLSYGVSGNSAVAPYATQSSLSKIPFAFGDDAAPGYTFSALLGNPNLGWELSATNNLGFDLGFFNNRISTSIDLYDTKTSDILLRRGLPSTTGLTSVYQNVGDTRNKGIEVALNTVNIRNKNLTWTSAITFSMNKEQIVSLVTKDDDSGNNLFIGYPIKVYYDYDKIGIWQTEEAALAGTNGQAPGDIKVRDVNGDGVIDAVNDRVVLGQRVAKWFGGFNNSIKYKGFDLQFYIFARFGETIRPDFLSKYHPAASNNSSSFVEFWTPENPTNEYPRPNSNLTANSLLYATSLGYVDGSYIRLRNVTLGYSLKKLKNPLLNGLRIYVTGTNLYTYTKSSKLSKYDPERRGSDSFPMTKAYTAGLSATF